jgi:hypothetical protein
MEQAGKAHTSQNIQDIIDRTSQTGQHRQEIKDKEEQLGPERQAQET